MNETEHDALSFERIVFFSDAVFAIVITLLVLEIKVPHIEPEHFTEATLRHELWEIKAKFLGFIYSFFIVGMMWFEHHRIFRFIKAFDPGLIWRNLIFLLFVAFIPFPTALFSEYFQSQTAFILYTLSFAAAALTKLWLWNHAVKNKATLLSKNIDEERVKRLSRRSWAVPIVCGIAIGMSFIAVGFGGLSFPFIPLVAYLLYPNKKKDKKKVPA